MPGWQYVMPIDSMSTVTDFYAFNDTVYFRVGRYRDSLYEAKEYILFSSNGGTKWETLPTTFPEQNNYTVYRLHQDSVRKEFSYLPLSGKLWLFAYRTSDSVYVFLTSDDFLKTVNEYPLPKDISAYLYKYRASGYEILVNPFDRNNLFLLLSENLNDFKYEDDMLRSRDGGRTWETTFTPKPTEVDIFEPARSYYILFNFRVPGSWMLYVTGSSNGSTNADYYITNDNGTSYSPVYIPIDPKYFGIGDSADVRAYREPGFISYSINSPQNIDTLSWVRDIYPDKYQYRDTNNYGYGLNIFNTSYNQINVKFAYHFFENSPSTSLMGIGEGGIIGGVPHATQWIFQTENDGKTWEKKWQSGPKSLHHISTLDQQLKVLWLVTDDTLTTATRKLKKYNLWKSQIKTKVKPDYITTDAPVVLFPNPAIDVLNIFISSKPQQHIIVEVFDVTCRVADRVYTGNLAKNEDCVEWIIPRGLASGVYVLRATIGEKTYCQKVIISR